MLEGSSHIDLNLFQPVQVHYTANPVDEWLNVGMAVHFETGGSDAGLDMWINWSARSDKFVDGEQEAKWPSFHLDHSNPRTLATLRTMTARFARR